MEAGCMAVSEQFRKIQPQLKDFHKRVRILHYAQVRFSPHPRAAKQRPAKNSKSKTKRKDKK
jgi:hypothetical protein